MTNSTFVPSRRYILSLQIALRAALVLSGVLLVTAFLR
jgi:hypothetical protein